MADANIGPLVIEWPEDTSPKSAELLAMWKAAFRAGAASMRSKAADTIKGISTEPSQIGYHYRRWPAYNPTGNLSSDDAITKFADIMSAAVSTLPLE